MLYVKIESNEDSKLQSKVSMVIPCYNKEKYIGGMFDSILAQEWNNIELILVNDGSTDKTLAIIREYEQKFIERGYSVTIINQENQGVSAAVRNGLENVTGQYVCQIDADDKLDPRYASLMAEYLDTNKDFSWVTCDALICNEDSTSYVKSLEIDGMNSITAIEKWILQASGRAIWIHMIRMDYLKQCKVIDLFYIGREGNQEAQIFIPLALGGGIMKNIREPLYLWQACDDNSHRSFCGTYEELITRHEGIIHVFFEVFKRVQLNDEDRARLIVISKLKHHMLMLREFITRDYNSIIINDKLDKVFSSIGQLQEETIETNSLAYIYTKLFHFALENNIAEVLPEEYNAPKGRVIAWGVLGENAALILPHLKETILEPTDYWDKQSYGNGIQKPNVSNLTEDDIVLILPSIPNVVSDITKALEVVSCKVITVDKIIPYVCAKLFPELYDGSISIKM